MEQDNEGWISIDTPPDKDDFYIVYSTTEPEEDLRVLMAAWETDHFTMWVNTPMKNVTHWRKRPLPPKQSKL